MMEPMDWLEVSVCVPPEAAEAVAEVLSRYAPQGVAIDLGEGDSQADSVTVKAYIPADDEIQTNRRKVEAAIGHLSHIWPIIPQPQFRPIQGQDWTAGWKESIPVLHLGENVVIKPSWRDYQPQPNDIVLEMDPGLAFGTGLHPTTQLCIEVLESLLQPNMRVLDLGTGTGVLAMIAAKMGATEVCAVDTDENAVIATRRNALANAVLPQIDLLHGSLADVTGVYDLVLANILAPVIIKMAQSGLASRVRVGGSLIVSGVLLEQAAEVSAALEAFGLRVVDQRSKGDWLVLLAERI